MKKNLIFAIACIAFFALTAVLLAFLPWAGYTLLILSSCFTIFYEIKYAKHQVKFFNNLRKQGALEELSAFKVVENDKLEKVKLVTFKNRILIYNSSIKEYHDFANIKKLTIQPKSSTAYGGFSMRFNNGDLLKILCLFPDKIKNLLKDYIANPKPVETSSEQLNKSETAMESNVETKQDLLVKTEVENKDAPQKQTDVAENPQN